MPGKNKLLFRYTQDILSRHIRDGVSSLILGPRQVGKTTLVRNCLPENGVYYTMADPSTRQEMERDPSLIIRRLRARKDKPVVFIDEAQKVTDIFDAAQVVIDEGFASFILTGSSARKLRRRGANLLPGRIRLIRLDPLSWSELGYISKSQIQELSMGNGKNMPQYAFEKSLVFGTLPSVVTMNDDKARSDFLQSYTYLYLEEEIRAEALSRKIGAFSRFLEIAAGESGTSPNFHKLSNEAGVSAPSIKEFYSILEDTLIVERIEPYLKSARKRILSSPRFYFFDSGVRNALARMPLSEDLIHTQKGVLFEHFVLLEIIRRVRLLNKGYRVCYWRTAGGAEVDCVVDTGATAIPIEIKWTSRVTSSDYRGLTQFLKDYSEIAPVGYIVTQGGEPEVISDRIHLLPWNYL
ncbi:MAG: ATP-binding protein [Vulcanimicrobiota bacterium]